MGGQRRLQTIESMTGVHRGFMHVALCLPAGTQCECATGCQSAALFEGAAGTAALLEGAAGTTAMFEGAAGTAVLFDGATGTAALFEGAPGTAAASTKIAPGPICGTANLVAMLALHLHLRESQLAVVALRPRLRIHTAQVLHPSWCRGLYCSSDSGVANACVPKNQCQP